MVVARFGETRLEDDIPIKLDAQTASLVSSLLKTSAERAAANAPIVLSRDSSLYKQYQQNRYEMPPYSCLFLSTILSQILLGFQEEHQGTILSQFSEKTLRA